MAAGMPSRIALGSSSRDPITSGVIEDELYQLKDENNGLKKRLNDQDDKTKRLLTKIQRMSEELSKVKRGAPLSKTAPAVSRRQMLEEEDLVFELRNQVQELSRNNLNLRNKALHYKNMSESAGRKTSAYSYVGSRVSAQPKRLVQSANAAPNRKFQGKVKNMITEVGIQQQDEEFWKEETEKLQEVITMLRAKLADYESRDGGDSDIVAQLRAQIDELLTKADVDAVAFQKQLEIKDKRIAELLKKYDGVDDRIRGIENVYHETLKHVEELSAQLKEERARNLELESKLKDMQITSKTIDDLNEMINDLRGEKSVLEKENARLIQDLFSTNKDSGYKNELLKYKEVITKLETELKNEYEEKKRMLAEIARLNDEIRDLRDEATGSRTKLFEMTQKFEEMQKYFEFFKDGVIDLAEIEEALTLLRLRKEKGVTLDFLVNIDDATNDKKLLDELRVQYADCIQELDKTRRLLGVQEQINAEYKAELEELKRKMDAMRNEYELRIEEDTRLLDLRNHKIANLEGQLKNIAYGSAKPQTATTETTDDIILAKGQNLIEVGVKSMILNDEGIRHVQDLNLKNFDFTNMDDVVSFVLFDFYDFETQMTPIRRGNKPSYNFVSKFPVFVDDFFLQYLQSTSISLDLCCSSGLDWARIATCNLVFRDIVTSDTRHKLQYFGDLICAFDKRTVIGKLEYELGARVHMAHAIRAFKERSVALNLLTVNEASSADGTAATAEQQVRRRFKSRLANNTLHISVERISGLKSHLGNQPSVFVAYNFFELCDVATAAVKKSNNPVFNHKKAIELPMTSDLDRYLRSTKLKLYVVEDSEVFGSEFAHGFAEVPLSKLAVNDEISGLYTIKTAHGTPNGEMVVSLRWESEYKITFMPIVSQQEVVSEPPELPKKVVPLDDDQNRIPDDDKEDDLSEISDGDAQQPEQPAEDDEDTRPIDPLPLANPNVHKLKETHQQFSQLSGMSTDSQVSASSAGASAAAEAARQQQPPAPLEKHSSSLSSGSVERYVQKIAPDVHNSKEQLAAAEAEAQAEQPQELTQSQAESLFEVISSKDALNISSRLVFIVERIDWDISSVKVQHILEDVRQIFVGYEFLSYPTEDLESKSIYMSPGDDGVAQVNFKREFYFDASKHTADRAALARVLRSDDASEGIITFTVVREPPEGVDAQFAECEDVALAEVDLRNLLQLDDRVIRLQIELTDITKSFNCGILSILIDGLDVLQSVFKE